MARALLDCLFIDDGAAVRKMHKCFSPLISLALAGGLLLFGPLALATENSPPTIAVIGFDLVDDQPDPARAEVLRGRLLAITRQLELGLHERALYRVLDTAAAQDLINAQRASNEFLYRCNNCLAEVGQRLGTRLVAVGWVQRVSELILNVNVSVQDSQTGVEVLSKSVDLRGNTDETWARGMNFMLRDWAERRARNPRYGF
jgi:Protein of unknown function (DUF2380)